MWFRRNVIVGLSTNRGRLVKVEEVKFEINHQFESRFTEPISKRLLLEGVTFKQLTLEERNSLEAALFVEEIKEVVWLSDKDKKPCPYGYNIGFFKTCWGSIKEDVVKFVNELYFNNKVRKVVTTSFLALIPKSDNPQSIEESRPIYLVGSLYRILEKLLDSIVKKVMCDLISKCQFAFLVF